MEYLYKINWILIGFIFGFFSGIFAVLFYVPYHSYLRPNNGGRKTGNLLILAFLLVFQFIYNATLPIAGGIGLLIFFDRLKGGFLGIPELLLLLMSVIALLGKLSDIIFKVPRALKEVFLNKVSGKKETGI
ncbi:MAG: hypothetical protein HPY46_08155 [Candidatus Aminicenantes bacterium]|nr:hypothetical protein [Candidatus Aminicenantes bacterium]